MRHPITATFFAILLMTAWVPVQAQSSDSSLVKKQWQVDGVTREALVHLPTQPSPKGAPLLFVFHGHGGTMGFSTRAGYHTLWPEAIVIYPQGLPTSGHITDPEGEKPGWQFSTGEYNDRDLKFFDAMLATAIQEYHANPKSVFVTGHSNGGRFSQLLWSARDDKLTAIAASATSALNLVSTYKPKPYLQISGEKDPLVSFRLQEFSFNAIMRVNGASKPGKVEKQFSDGELTRYPSTLNAPTLLLLHQGGHTLTAEGPQTIVQFFKEFSSP